MDRFAKAEKELTEQGYSVVNPAKVNAQMPEDMTYEAYMKMCFAMMDLCDAIYMLNGWEKSCGASRECVRANEKGMVILVEGSGK